tara:strand:- start:3038 stop:3445 length:408 start_codon:yes stop_codon:yes gene_type:complete
MQEIIQNLYLGNQESTDNPETIGIGINYIISIGSISKNKSVESFHINLRDDKTLNIDKELNLITSLIHYQLYKNKKILIHCKSGVNRAPSFVLSYLCKYSGFSIDEAIEHILSRRKICKFSFKPHVVKWLEGSNF